MLILTLLSSCGQLPDKEPTKPLASVSIDSISKIPVDRSSKDFTVFWRTYRQAILNKDTIAIFALTKFPIETRGPMDSDPVVKYPQNIFKKILPIFLALESGISEGTELDLIKSTTVPASDDVSGETARIGNSVFDLVDGQWRLTFLYLHPPVLEAIEKNGW